MPKNVDSNLKSQTRSYPITAEAGRPASTILQEANIGIYTIPECEALWSEEEINDEEHVCIGTPNEAGSCSVSSMVQVVGKRTTKNIYLPRTISMTNLL